MRITNSPVQTKTGKHLTHVVVMIVVRLRSGDAKRVLECDELVASLDDLAQSVDGCPTLSDIQLSASKACREERDELGRDADIGGFQCDEIGLRNQVIAKLGDIAAGDAVQLQRLQNRKPSVQAPGKIRRAATELKGSNVAQRME